MALFGKKSEQVEREATKVAPSAKGSVPQLYDTASVIVKPRITEKAALLIDKNVYTFEVRKDATKHEVRDAVKKLYNVTPVAIRMVTKKPRHSMSRMRGRDVMEHGLKKAYIYLKEGDRIDLI